MIHEPEMLVALIGKRVRYAGEEFELTDLLFEEGLLILSSAEGETVQEDSYGRPSRLVPSSQELRFRDAQGQPGSVWDELVFLDGPLSG